VSVELYVPTVASFGLRKVSLMYMSYLIHLTARSQWSLAVKLTLARRRKPLGHSKVRIPLFYHMTIHVFPEKSSWISVARTPAGAGQWRPATCKLTDEDESCSLNIYVDVGLRKTDVLQSSECLHRRLFCTRPSTFICSIISTSGTLTPPYSFARIVWRLHLLGKSSLILFAALLMKLLSKRTAVGLFS
jgi:hypothetical protein